MTVIDLSVQFMVKVMVPDTQRLTSQTLRVV